MLTKDERRIIYKKLDWFDWYIARFAHNPQIIQWLEDQGLPLDKLNTECKNSHILQNLKNYGFPLIANMCGHAAYYGYLDILQWLGDQGLTYTENTCLNAAKNGQLDVLKWLREQKVPWDESTCARAELFNHLHVLKWCISQGAPMYEWTKNYCHEKGLLL